MNQESNTMTISRMSLLRVNIIVKNTWHISQEKEYYDE